MNTKMEEREEIIRKLKESGMRITKQRLILLDIILEGECSSSKELYYKASKKDANIGTATMYRLLNVLEELGVINRANMYKIEASDSRESIDYHEIIECITCALDAKDPYTAGHSQRVSDMALIVCNLLHLKPEEAEKIHIAAHLHDIGKIGVPDAVLNKTARLNGEEWEKMKCHPEIGAEILSKSQHLSEVKNMVLSHHERFDGTGYPQGLKGEEIPMGARIIAICDSIDAMTSNRSYRMAHGFDFCYQEIEKNLGKMYDPYIGKLVLKNWEKMIKFLNNGKQLENR